MVSSTPSQPLAVVALGGNALLPRGLPTTADNQLLAVRGAAEQLAQAAANVRLVVTHGSGPQVGLLSLKEEAFPGGDPYPLDVLDAESGGQLGYVVELALANAAPSLSTLAVLTRVLVAAEDPAFQNPTKFIGPQYTEGQAHALAAERSWQVRADGDHWRRVVPSPDPKSIFQLAPIAQLVDHGFTVVCVGGGGIPVVATESGFKGVEAVIDKDLSSALLAVGLGADLLVLVTDVQAAYTDWGTPDQRPIRETTPHDLRALSFPDGSMGPKIEAVCRFVEATGGRAVIGALDELPALIEGTTGTQVQADFRPEAAPDEYRSPPATPNR